ncbi:MAG: 2-amino-4-hydroxy-6-hydroxymethyldihydropteridine diphosphokinase [Segetibacter sp.]|jgi:2-amino-4-hydroxy-6-hydroxymethyldihydropteridine diphosphokinase|nr:2-amino-4-hydroxy-6-hydroxymethyldihydropteridine diphosphokinase [Segetibacter sp.]
MNNVYLLTGGNLGDRLVNLQKAFMLIDEMAGSVIKKSSIYETAAWGITNQPSFLNQVLFCTTQLTAVQLLQTILLIEKQMGRERLEKLGPRIIDIDILFYNDEVIDLPELKVPHPEITNRRFVLEPLHEIAPDYIHPVLKRSIADLLKDCPDPLEVKMLEQE